MLLLRIVEADSKISRPVFSQSTLCKVRDFLAFFGRKVKEGV